MSFKKVGVGFLVFLLVSAFSVGGYFIINGFIGGDTQVSQLTNLTEVNAESLFRLEAVEEEDSGIKRDTSFTLTTPESVSKADLEAAIVFEPATEFTVKSNGTLSGIIPAAKAQSEADKELLPGNIAKNVYEITPKTELAAGKLYKVKIGQTSETINREYSWAFQTVAPFQVVNTHPRNQGVNVSTNSTIEIFLNRDGVTVPDRHISISPAVKGQFEVIDRKIIFKHGGLTEDTVYTVKVAAGLSAGNDEDQLNKDFQFQFETKNTSRTSSGREPTINFRKAYASFYPSQKPTFDVYSYDVNDALAANYDLNIYKYNSSDSFIQNYTASRDWNLGWTSYYRNNVLKNTELKDTNKIATIKPELVEANYQNYIELPDNLEPGSYAAELVHNDERSLIWFQVTPLSYYYSYTEGNGFVWLFDMEQNQPVANVKVGISQGTDKVNNFATTGSNGVTEFETPKLLQPREDDSEVDFTPHFFHFSADGYDDVVAPASSSYWGSVHAESGDQYWDFVSTERYVYRPSDSLKFWGVVKSRNDDLRQDKVKVSLARSGYFFDGYTNSDIMAQTESVVSSFDTIEGELNFKGVAPGFYTVRVEHNDKIVSFTEIEILDFSKPAYQITATPSADSVIVGTPVTIDIEAKFFDGTPVPNLDLEYNVSSDNGELTLDENGKGQLVYTPKSRNRDYTYGPFTVNFYFDNKTAEEGEISGQTKILVFENDIHMQLIRDRKADGSVDLTAKLNEVELANAVNDANGYYRQEFIGASVANKAVEAEITAVYYDKVENGFYYDPVNRVSRTRYKYNRREETVSTLNGSTNANGEWTFNFEPAADAPKFTSYYVVLNTNDGRGVNMKTKNYVSSSQGPSYQNSLPVSLVLNSEEQSNEFSVGDDINLELQIDEDKERSSDQVLYYGYTNEVVDLDVTTALEVTRSFKDRSIPGVAYQAIIVGPYGFEETNRVIASYKQDDSKLNIQVESDKERYKPGEEVSLAVEVRDNNNQATVAEVNLAAVDEALFHVLPYNYRVDMLNKLFAHNIVRPITGSSRNSNIIATEGAEKGGCFLPDTPIMMSDETFKNIEDINIGDQILTFVADDNAKKVIATVQGIQTYLVDEYVVINNKLEVTPEHRIFLNGDWQFAGVAKKGDYLTLANGSKEVVTSVDYVSSPNTKVYNIVVSKYHTYLAHNYYVHNAEKGGSERSDFKDVALFESVATSSSGKAGAKFQLPDNITSWRVTARAFDTENIRAGDTNKQIPVGLPLFAATSLNETYLAGDTPKIPIRAFGTEIENAEINYKLTSKTLGLDLTASSAEREHLFDVDPLPIGKHELKLTVEQGSLKDTLVKQIEVIDSYIVSVKSDSQPLTEASPVLSGNPNGITKLTFTDNGKGKYAPRLNSLSWNYGTRLDQLITQQLATKLLNEHFGQDRQVGTFNLSDYYTDSNGLALFTYSDDDLELTARAAASIPDQVYESKTIAYLNDALTNEKADTERIAIALYGLAGLEQPVLNKIKTLQAEGNLSVKEKLYLGLALSAIGDKEAAARLYKNQIRPELTFEGDRGTIVKDKELNALVALLAAKANYDEDAFRLLNGTRYYDNSGRLDRIDKVQTIAELIARVSSKEASVTVVGKDETKELDLSNGYPQTLDLTFEQLEAVKFEKIKGDILLTSTYDGFGIEAGKDSSLGITREYSVNGQVTNNFKAGDLVKVKLRVTDSDQTISTNYQIKDYLPSGLNPVIRSYGRGQFSSNNWCEYPSWGAQKLGNTVHFSRGSWLTSASGNCESGVLIYYARVVSPGSFTAEAPQVQPATSLDKIAVGEATKVEITN